MSTVTPALGFIGLGVMGSGMCANVVRKHASPVHAFDLNEGALAAQVANGAVEAESVADLAAKSDIIFLSLPGGTQVKAVCREIAQHAGSETVVVDLSTTAMTEAREVAAMLSDHGIGFADAPVARAKKAAIDGTLAIMVGASEALFARIDPLLHYMGTDVTHCGDVGCGQVVKLVNNTLLFEQVAALSEMFVVAERAGVAPTKLAEAVSLGSGDSFALRNHGMKSLVPRTFPGEAFGSAYALKDLGYAIDLAEQMGVEVKMPRLTSEYYQTAVDEGLGDKYFPVIIETIDRK